MSPLFNAVRLSRRVFAGALFGAGAIAIACGGGGDDEATAVPSPTSAPQPTATPDVVIVDATSETSSQAPTPVITVAAIASPTATPRPTVAPTAAPTAAPRPAPTATPVPPTATPVPPTPTNTPVPTPTQDPFEEHFLAFDAPEFFDDTTDQPTYTVVGRTRVDAFVTINDTIVDVDENGRFSLEIQLEEGINIVEVVASVSDAEALDEVLTIIHAQ